MPTVRAQTCRGAVAVLGAVVACAATLVAGMPAASANPASSRQHLHPRVLAAFRRDAQFAESLTRGPRGALFASVTTWGQQVNRGRIYRISADGARSQFGPALRTPGILTGVAFDAAGHLYVADATFGAAPAPGVFRVTRSKMTRVLTLPADTFPNGLVFSRGALYVSDSDAGRIWRWNPGTQPAPATLSSPWLRSPRLAAQGKVNGIGANGLAVRRGVLYIAVSDAGENRAGKSLGRLAAVPFGPGGTHGKLSVVRTSPKLATVDGIDFSGAGPLWLVTNGIFAKDGTPVGGQRLLRMTHDGAVHVVASDTRWMNYPTAVLVRHNHGHRTIDFENGALFGGRATVLRLR
ncbi:MAG TPA: hypothetical protein VFH38_05595 [Jatrophihabitans sp.]|nr:hypothetical protein [Jatrophihabitans sp.]